MDILRLLLLLPFVSTGNVDSPPKQYDVPYDGPYIIRHYPLDEVDARCRKGWNARGLDPGVEKIVACGGEVVLYGTKRVCFMILPSPGTVSDSVYSKLYKHEQAHCNGWSFH